MSDESVLLAVIEEWNQYGISDFRWPRRANDAVLANIPVDDPYWPPLCKAMVSVTGDDEMHGSSKCCRVITITGHLNHGATHGLSDWLDKVEDLLGQLYWQHAEVLVLRSYCCPPLLLIYSPSQRTFEQYPARPPQPGKGWTLQTFKLTLEPFDISQVYSVRARPLSSE